MKVRKTPARLVIPAALSGLLMWSQCAERRESPPVGGGLKDMALVLDPGAMEDASRAASWSEQMRDMAVSGDSIGFAGVPGAFFLLQRSILAAGAPGAVQRLLYSDVPEARAMALSVAARNPATGRAVLAAHTCDDGQIDYNPNGCIVYRRSVGEFARELLEEPGILGGCDTCQNPLLGADELQRLDWLALSSDSCANVHQLAARKIVSGAQFAVLAANPTWEALQDHLPEVDAWRMVKALARVMPRAGRNVDPRLFRDLLEATATARSTPSRARLAAASALTRVGVEETLETLERLRPELDALEPGEPGQTVLQALRGRLAFDAETEALRKSNTWMETQALAPKVIATFEHFGSEPFALDLILEVARNSFGSYTDDVRIVVDRALESQVERARYPFADWDIESDLAYRLRRGAAAAGDDVALRALLARAGRPLL
jgi:hypothetical protein